jgi:hypothetical protein
MFSVRKWQISALAEIFTDSRTQVDSDILMDKWRILVLDKQAKFILSPLMNTFQFKKRFGVTLILSVESKRPPIPGVEAVYIVSSTEDNIKIISDV